jgi:hypothetical protein
MGLYSKIWRFWGITNSSRASIWTSIFHAPPNSHTHPPFLEALHFPLQTWDPPLFIFFIFLFTWPPHPFSPCGGAEANAPVCRLQAPPRASLPSPPPPPACPPPTAHLVPGRAQHGRWSASGPVPTSVPERQDSAALPRVAALRQHRCGRGHWRAVMAVRFPLNPTRSSSSQTS